MRQNIVLMCVQLVKNIMWILLGGFVFTVCLTSDVFGGLANWRHSRRLLALSVGDENLRDEWLIQKLDHFDPPNGQTWWQRYQTNATWFKNSRNSPVFLMIGGEGPASAKWMVMGSWMDYAKKYNALCFQLEHRFYGASQPKDLDLTVSSLRYLNSEQALADVAYFIEAMNEKYKLTSSNKWIVFGGSYSGSLAAWARLKYPHLIHAAVSSSAPILAVADFKGYDEVVRQALTFSSPSCAKNVNEAALLVENRLKTSSDVEGLAKKFNRCSLNTTNRFELAFFVDSLADNFRGAVQYSHDNRRPLHSVGLPTVDQLCEIMTNEKLDLIGRYAEVNQFMSLGDPDTCQDVTYEDFVQELRGVSAARSWYYQTCTEFGFYQTSSTHKSLFGSLLNLEFFVETCKRIFDNEFNFYRMLKGIRRSNILYGGLDIEVSRVVFIQGTLDPWHVLGLTKSSKVGNTVILINGTAHCANMYPPSQNDSVQLINARNEIEGLIGKWLSG